MRERETETFESQILIMPLGVGLFLIVPYPPVTGFSIHLAMQMKLQWLLLSCLLTYKYVWRAYRQGERERDF